MVVSGTIAPTRDIPELTAEDTIRIILSNLNLVVPVVAALLVIIIAIIVICVLRNKGNNNKGIIIFLFLSYPLQTNLPLCYRYRSSNCNTKNTHTRSRFIQKNLKKKRHRHPPSKFKKKIRYDRPERRFDPAGGHLPALDPALDRPERDGAADCDHHRGGGGRSGDLRSDLTPTGRRSSLRTEGCLL